jgi:hypothetical protein
MKLGADPRLGGRNTPADNESGAKIILEHRLVAYIDFLRFRSAIVAQTDDVQTDISQRVAQREVSALVSVRK